LEEAPEWGGEMGMGKCRRGGEGEVAIKWVEGKDGD